MSSRGCVRTQSEELGFISDVGLWLKLPRQALDLMA